MRALSITSLSIIAAIGLGCGDKEDAKEAARREAEALEQATAAKPAPKVLPPVPGEQRIPCEQLIPDPEPYRTALGETEPVSVRDVTRGDAEAAASCSIVRGGEKLTAKQQEELAKKTNRRMGVLPGEDLCNVTAYCWTVETEENFRLRCKQRGHKDDESTMGSYSCVQVVAQGADDVNVHRFFHPDTKCILQVRGGPSNVDNDKIAACARTARDTIGPEHIRVAAPTP
jgi:hypothetical protein